jgi:glycosyltransferase involved in cell wall biosynthesis
MSDRAAIIVPCYNEARRLDQKEFVRLLEWDVGVQLVFVDDGSTDGTLEVLYALAREVPGRVLVVAQPKNQGKAEAVRQGMLHALQEFSQEIEASIVGYLDADLATPVDEALRLLARIRSAPCDVLLASRVALLGRDIMRTTPRHYVGRVFASVASAILQLRVYDTQCGAKFFRRTPGLAAALEQPFISRWAFDVELLGRLTSGPHPVPVERIIEEPLLVWHDVANSKLGFVQMGGAGVDLVKIAWSLRRRQRSV